MKKLLFIAFSLFLFVGMQAQDIKQISRGRTGKDVGRINATIRQVNDLSAPAYTYLHFADSAVVVALTADVWALVANTGNDLYASEAYNEMTIVADSLTVINPGHYKGWVKIKYAATASDSIGFALFKNEVITTPLTLWVSTGTEAVYANLPFFLPSLVVGDDITLKVINYASSDDATVESVTWFTEYMDK